MSSLSSVIPPEWDAIASRLESVASIVQDHVTMDWAKWPDSIAARELACEDQFPGLALRHPVRHTLLTPRHGLGAAGDHLVAMAAILRAPGTIMAALTVLRTEMVGCARAAYVAEGGISGRERVRRGMNAYLDSMTEQMRLIGRDDAESAAEFERLTGRRRQLIRGARALGWPVSAQETSKMQWWPRDWWIGDKPPSESSLVGVVFGDIAAESRAGKRMYQYLSATTHGQLYGLLSLLRPEHTVEKPDGVAQMRATMDAKMLNLLALTALVGLTVAMDRCIALYGWSPEPWRLDVIPFVRELRFAVGMRP